ncbi:tail protein [Stappia sp. 22II-S9-Z10]|nr:tail protein [Stappia sp. 22II-S9-Z10]
MPSAKTVKSLQGDTVDLLVKRHYGRTAGVTELVLSANPGLAALGVVLPLGTPVKMPAIAQRQAAATLVRLWD